MKTLIRTYTYTFCPLCGYRLQECSDDEDKDNYYECFGCGAEFDLDGFERYVIVLGKVRS